MKERAENIGKNRQLDFESFREFSGSLISAAILDASSGNLIAMEFLTKEEYQLFAKDKSYAEYAVTKIQPGCERDSLLVNITKRDKALAKNEPDFPHESSLDFSKFRDVNEGLVSASIIDKISNRYLMTGYMSKKSIELTAELGKVVFFSRTSNNIWIKGETSKNFIRPRKISILSPSSISIEAWMFGPICHMDTETCFNTNTYYLNQIKIAKTLDDFTYNFEQARTDLQSFARNL